MVYRKAMALSGAEVARMGVGGIANLQSNDVQKMSRFRLDINPLWDAPFQVRVWPPAREHVNASLRHSARCTCFGAAPLRLYPFIELDYIASLPLRLG